MNDDHRPPVDIFNPDALAGRGNAMSAMNRVFNMVYGWMALGLLLTGAVAWYTVNTDLYKVIFNNQLLYLGLIFGELALVAFLSVRIRSMAPAVASALFFAYAALNGLTLSVVLLVYTEASVASTFFITAGMFGGLSLFGILTKRDLSGIGAFCGMALWGLILAMFVNFFLGSAKLLYGISAIGVIVFAGLAAYDAQKIRQIAEEAGRSGFDDSIRRAAVLGSLALYLDFINLFLMLLRLMGNRK